MKCIICKTYSIKIICVKCQKTFLTPQLSTRILSDGFKIFSFYFYDDIADLLKTKHTYIGSSVYAILAKNAFRFFIDDLFTKEMIYAIPIDDHIINGYSHTAILAKALKSKNIKPVFNSLRAKNNITYSGKTLEYRLKNPREFEYTFKSEIDAILIDDIVTSTTTINEAKNTLLKAGVNPIFALTLADARES